MPKRTPTPPTPPRTQDQPLPLPIAAQRLGVALQTLRNWISMGRLDSVKIGGRRLILESTIDALIARSLQPASCHQSLRL